MFRCTSSEIPCLARFPTLRRGFLAGQGISSLPTVIHCAGLAVGGSPIPFRDFKISILTVPSSSSQATYRLRRAFSFHCKAHRALIEAAPRFQLRPAALGSQFGVAAAQQFRFAPGPDLFYQHRTQKKDMTMGRVLLLAFGAIYRQNWAWRSEISNKCMKTSHRKDSFQGICRTRHL